MTMNTYTFLELSLGNSESFEKKVTQEDMALFSGITGDRNPLHLDEGYAKSAGFKGCVGFGMLGSSLHSTLAGMYLPGKYSLIVKEESSFLSPIYPGDTLTVTGTITDKKEFGNLIMLSTEIKNQQDEMVIKGKMIVKVLK